MTALLVVAAVMLVVIGAIHATDTRRQDTVRRTMDGLLTGRGRATLDELALTIRENRNFMGACFSVARRDRDAGRYQEAVRRLGAGCDIIEELAPDFLEALAALRRLARAVIVIASPPPLPPRSFRTRRLVGLATAAVVVHQFLLTGRQKVLLRLRVITATFRLAVRWLRPATRRAAVRPEHLAAWQQVDALEADLATAGDEALVTARQIVQALDAVSLGVPVTSTAKL